MRIVAILAFFSIFYFLVTIFPLIFTTDLQVFEVFVMYSSKSLMFCVFVGLLIVHVIALRGQLTFFSKFREEEGVKQESSHIQTTISTSI